MLRYDENKLKTVGLILNDSERPLKARFRALFTLKNVGGDIAIDLISKCFNDDSVLLKHELAYCLGQMQDRSAIFVLKQLVEDKKQDPMVRHEAGEALAAIGDPSVIDFLEKYCTDEVVEVAETCQIAVQKLKWLANPTENANPSSTNPYASVDPAPPLEKLDVNHLEEALLDEKLPLFDRYRAMFSLRNMKTNESVVALGHGLKASSALFRHEIAFVLGQMQHEKSIPFLVENLKDMNENEMVRHECAEALGAIATPECMEVLEAFRNDSKAVVRESCEIALDMCDYFLKDEFQYANTYTNM